MAEVDVETGEAPVVFEGDVDRHAWRDYAVAALRSLMPAVEARLDDGSARHMGTAARVACVADAMLVEERRRRNPRHGRRRGR